MYNQNRERDHISGVFTYTTCLGIMVLNDNLTERARAKKRRGQQFLYFCCKYHRMGINVHFPLSRPPAMTTNLTILIMRIFEVTLCHVEPLIPLYNVLVSTEKYS